MAAGLLENHLGLDQAVQSTDPAATSQSSTEALANGHLESDGIGARSGTAGATVKRQAVIELDVLNRTEMALQVRSNALPLPPNVLLQLRLAYGC